MLSGAENHPMPLENLQFTPTLLTRPAPSGLAAETTLEHFAIVTYWVDPACLRKHLHPRFEPDCVISDGAAPRALVSVVTFVDRDFRFVACPRPSARFGQTNYRAYVTDTATGEHVVWFFGTCLDSLSVVVPRHLWKLPWHRGRMRFDCHYDEKLSRYSAFNVTTSSRWAPARLRLRDSGRASTRLPGFSNLEAGLVLLTHPMRGYFRRRDGALGTYSIWHDRLNPTVGDVEFAEFPLLTALGLVELGDHDAVQSVLIQRRIDFTIYLPPMVVDTPSPT